MIQYTDTVKDERSQSPIEGAEVYVYNVAENDNDAPSLATLYASDGTTEIGNPLTTNNLGVYSFYHPATELIGDVYVGARLRYRSRLFVGGGYAGAAQAAAAAAQNAVGIQSYANTAAGLAATDIGETFWVNNADGTGTTYRHDAGPVATAVGKFILDQTASDAADIFAGGVPTKAALAAPTGAEMVGNQLPAGDDLAIQPVSDFINNNVLQPSQFVGTPEEQLVRAIAEAGEARPTIGQTVQLPRAEIVTTVPFNMQNRATLRGVNKRGSVIQAAPGFTGDYMVTVLNGTTSTFDNGLEHLTIDCNDVAGLGGIDSQAWQEGGGLRNVLLLSFRTHGIRFREGFGGASTCLIRECEIFGGAAGGPAISGIRVEEISLVGNFLLRVCDSTITGRGGTPMTYGIEVENDSLHCYVVHFEDVGSGVYLDGVGNHVLIGVSGANTVTNVVEIAPTFLGSLSMVGCFRGGATNLLKDNRVGGLGTISVDRDIRIDARPPLALGSIMAAGLVDGSTATLTKGFGITSVARTAAVPAGSYDLTLETTAQATADWAPFASSNGFEGNVRCSCLGVNTVRIETFNAAGALTNVNELKFQVVRVG